MRVVVSGAGIAGPTLAYWLLRGGHNVVLVEKAAQLRTGGYMIDFWGVGYTVAERMGLLPAVQDAGYFVKEVRFVNSQGRRAGGFLVDSIRSIANNRFVSLPRGDLATLVYRAIEGRVESIFDNTITAIDQTTSGVHVSFERGPTRNFDLVIGADGLHSRVRQLVFGPERDFERRLGYHVAAFCVDGYQPRDELVYVCYCLPGRQVSRFALRGDRTMFLFVWAGNSAQNEPGGIEERKSVLHRLFDDAGWECSRILRAMDQAADIYFDGVNQIRMSQWSQGRVMLLGDAAACVSLLAGEGTGLAMTEAYVLAGELSRANGDYCLAFQRTEQQLRSLIEQKQKSAERFASAFAPKTWLGIWFRNQVTKLITLPGIAPWLIGRELRDDYELPKYRI